MQTYLYIEYTRQELNGEINMNTTKKELALKLATKDIEHLILKGNIDPQRKEEAIQKFSKIHERSSLNILKMKVKENIVSFK